MREIYEVLTSLEPTAAELIELRARDIAPQLPDLRAARDQLRGYVQRRGAGTVEVLRRKRLAIVTEETVAALQAMRWPGNIRQLRNVLSRAIVLSGSREEIRESDIEF